MQLRTTTTPGEAAAIVALCFGWFILGSTYAVVAGFRSDFYSEGAMIRLILIEALLGMTALYALRSRGFDVASLYPRPSLAGVAGGVLLYLAAASAAWLSAMPLDPSLYSEPLERLIGGTPIGLPVLVALGMVNGSYEEIFLLGFLARGLRAYGLSVAIGVSLLVRVLYHLYQGPLGAVYVLGFGLVLTVSYVATGKLFPAVFAHAVADIVPFIW